MTTTTPGCDRQALAVAFRPIRTTTLVVLSLAFIAGVGAGFVDLRLCFLPAAVVFGWSQIGGG
jgi:hypothetical protein